MARNDAGLAHDYWKRYYTPAEVAEIIATTTTTTIISGSLPIHVRLYERPGSASTVVMSHGLITYGLALARLQLPFYRAGFNVVQWDMPGFGQSGGPRGGCTVDQAIGTWKDVLAWVRQEFGSPLYTTGFGEDGTICYYAVANDPAIGAMSFHNLWEYGDPDVIQWQGPPWLIQVKKSVLAVGKGLRPTRSVEMRKAVPWDSLFGPSDESEFRSVFEADPLRNHGYQYTLAYSMLQNRRPEVRFEDCRTPIQLIVSELNRLWPYRMNLRSFHRLGGPKELITLKDKPHWEFNREFDENFCAHAIRWFQAHGAVTIA